MTHQSQNFNGLRPWAFPYMLGQKALLRLLVICVGDFVDTDEDTKRRNHLYWALICVKKSGTVLPNKIKLEVGDRNIEITIIIDTHAKFWVAGNSKSSAGDSNATNDGKREASSLAPLKFADRQVGQHVICPEISKFCDGVGPSAYKGKIAKLNNV